MKLTTSLVLASASLSQTIFANPLPINAPLPNLFTRQTLTPLSGFTLPQGMIVLSTLTDPTHNH